MEAIPSSVENLISLFLSSSEEKQSEGESMFDKMIEQDPDSLILYLARILAPCDSHDAAFREKCAFLFHRCHFWYNVLTEPTQSAIKSILVVHINHEECSGYILVAQCYVISGICNVSNIWPELFHFLQECITSDSNGLKSSFSYIFSNLAPEICKQLFPDIMSLRPLFQKTMNDDTLNFYTRGAALDAATKFVQCLSSLNEVNQVQSLYPAMMRTLADALIQGDVAAVPSLQCYIKLAKNEPRFFRFYIVDTVNTMFEIAENTNLEDRTRHSALEFLLTLVEAKEKAAGMMKVVPQFTHNYVALLLNLLLDVKDEPSWNSVENHLDEAWASVSCKAGSDFLKRFSITISANITYFIAMEQLDAYLVSPMWEKRHAALIALVSISEGCSKVIIFKYLDELASMVLSSLKDPHPRVRWAAIISSMWLSSEFFPYLQEQYHIQVVSELGAAMDDFEQPRVQAATVAAISDYFNSHENPETLLPYLDAILNKLLLLLQSDNQMVQQQVIDAFTVVVYKSKEYYQKYNELIMPHLKTMLANDKSNHMLHSRALRCISLIAAVAGREKIREISRSNQSLQFEHHHTPTAPTALQISRSNQSLQFQHHRTLSAPPALQIPRSDQSLQFEHHRTFSAIPRSNQSLQFEHHRTLSAPLALQISRSDWSLQFEHHRTPPTVMKVLVKAPWKEFGTTDQISRAWASIGSCLGEDFLPIMSTVVPLLLKYASLQSHNIIDESYNSIDKANFEDEMIYVKESDFLEVKSAGCDILGVYATILGEDFYPWIFEAASILVPLLKCYVDRNLREKASSALNRVLGSTKLAIEKGVAQGESELCFKLLSGGIIMDLTDALYTEFETEICACMLCSLCCCLKICGLLLGEDLIRNIMNVIKHVITTSSGRRGELSQRENSDDFGAEEAKLMREEIDQEDVIFMNVGIILTTLIKTFNAPFLPFLDELSSYLLPEKDMTATQRSTCYSIFANLVDNCGDEALKYCGIYLPFLLDSSNDEDPVVRQNAVYGLGLCAEHDVFIFKPFVGGALPRINEVITYLHAREPGNELAFDNAVSTLGKICLFHRESIDSEQIIPVWLNCLPIKDDIAEAKYVHDQLCLMVERLDTYLLGPNYENFPKILSVFAEVLCAINDLATEETKKRMIYVLKNLQQIIPQATWAFAWSLLLPHHEMELESVLSPEEDANFSSEQ